MLPHSRALVLMKLHVTHTREAWQVHVRGASATFQLLRHMIHNFTTNEISQGRNVILGWVLRKLEQTLCDAK